MKTYEEAIAYYGEQMLHAELSGGYTYEVYNECARCLMYVYEKGEEVYDDLEAAHKVAWIEQRKKWANKL